MNRLLGEDLFSGMAFNELDNTLSGEILPRFRLRVDADKDEILDYLDQVCKESAEVVHIRAKQYLILKIPMSQREYWSPELQIQPFQDYDDKHKTLVRCVVGPTQSVWMLFTFLYSALILLTLFGGMFGLVQQQLTQSSAFLWAWPVGIVLVFSVFIVSKIGQRKARNQTLRLVSFLMHSLQIQWEIERVK